MIILLFLLVYLLVFIFAPAITQFNRFTQGEYFATPSVKEYTIVVQLTTNLFITYFFVQI